MWSRFLEPLPLTLSSPEPRASSPPVRRSICGPSASCLSKEWRGGRERASKENRKIWGDMEPQVRRLSLSGERFEQKLSSVFKIFSEPKRDRKGRRRGRRRRLFVPVCLYVCTCCCLRVCAPVCLCVCVCPILSNEGEALPKLLKTFSPVLRSKRKCGGES